MAKTVLLSDTLKVLVLSDIHANLEALQAVLDNVQTTYGKPDEIWFLGDMVGYGADPGACIDLLNGGHTVTSGVKLRAIRGNHDDGTLQMSTGGTGISPSVDIQQSWQWTASVLTGEQRAFLEHAPVTLDVPGTSRSVRLVHSSLKDPLGSQGTYLQIPSDFEADADSLKEQMCFFGHTHLACYVLCDTQRHTSQPRLFHHYQRQDQVVPIDLPRERKVFINPGTVGQPRWGYSNSVNGSYVGEPRASYVWLTMNDRLCRVACHFVDYPIEQAVSRLAGIPWHDTRGVPERWKNRLRQGLR